MHDTAYTINNDQLLIFQFMKKTLFKPAQIMQ